MKVLNLLTSGGVGGIEVLCKDIAELEPDNNIYCFLFGQGLIYDQMKENNRKVYSLSESGKLSLKKLLKLKRLAQNSSIVIVHHDDPFLQLYYILLRLLCRKKKYISIVHHCNDLQNSNKKYGFIKKKIKKLMTKTMFLCSHRIVFVSNAGFTSYEEEYKLSRDKVSIVYNGISKDKLEKGNNSLKTKEKNIRLVYVGRLVKLKGVDILIEAFSEIANKYDVALDIVGDGEEYHKLEVLVKQLKLESKIKFHGFRKDVTPFLCNSDIFIYPSKTEIFGISIVEAMAFRTICVANNVGGIPEIIRHGTNGFLNISGDKRGLCEAITLAINAFNDVDEKTRITNNARKTAEKYTISNTVKELNKVFMEVESK